MALYPNGRRDLFGFSPMRTASHSAYFQHVPRQGSRPDRTLVLAATDSYPGGAAPSAAVVWPIVAGGMSARAVMAATATANLLRGGPMQASFASAMTMAEPSLSLTVSMQATWVGSLSAEANLRMTIGMQASFAAALTASANLAMIVPLGSTTFAVSFAGTANLKGRCAMQASFGGATPLAQEVAAEVITRMNADAPAVNVAKVNGYALTGAGTSGDPWGPA